MGCLLGWAFFVPCPLPFIFSFPFLSLNHTAALNFFNNHMASPCHALCSPRHRLGDLNEWLVTAHLAALKTMLERPQNCNYRIEDLRDIWLLTTFYHSSCANGLGSHNLWLINHLPLLQSWGKFWQGIKSYDRLVTVKSWHPITGNMNQTIAMLVRIIIISTHY